MILEGALLGAGLAAAGLGWAYQKTGGTTGDLRLHRLGPDVYIYRGFFSNSGALVLKDRVVVVDTQTTPQVGARLAAEIARVTPHPVRVVINTHYHGDHVGGNAAFPDAEIIAPADTARYVHERDQERVDYCHTFGLLLQDVPPVRPPDRTFDGSLDLDLDGERLELRQLGRVETPDAAVVWWPRRRAVLVGDGVATDQYPWLGVPFLDEGLQDDGQWVGYLQKIKALRPEILIPGHGQPLVGEARIARRLDLLSALLTDLMETTRAEIAAGTELPELVHRVDTRLARYRTRKDLVERVVSQRFAIWRAYNSLHPSRRGKGWWHDLRPSAIRRAPDAEVAAATQGKAGEALHALINTWIAQNRLPLALSAAEQAVAQDPNDGEGWALLAEAAVRGALSTRPIVDGMEYVRLAARAARRALDLEPHNPVALLNLGAMEGWSALVTGQDQGPALDRLRAALASDDLDRSQRQRAWFFLARAHQAEGRDADANAAYAQLLPGPLRLLAPILVPRMWTLP